jgi:hypothetical protein
VLPLPERLRAFLGLEYIREGGAQPTTSWRVLKNPKFRLYFAGSVVSDLGTWLQNTAQVLLAYRLGHSVLAVGLVTCAQFSSPLVLGPWAGVLADRFGGRRTLLGTQVVAGVIALVLGYLEFAGLLNESGLVSGAILSGLCFTFALPARNVIVRRLVPAEEVRAAYVMDAVSYNLGRAIAPLMSIAMVYWVGYGWAFVGNSVSFAVFTVVLWGVGRSGMVEPERRSRIMDGFRIAFSEGQIMILLLMVAAVTIADDPVLVLGPALASRMHVSPIWSGWFIAALGTGSVLGSLRRSKHLPSLRLAATALALLGGFMVLFVMAPWIWASDAAVGASVAVTAATGAGISCLIANAATRTLLSQAAGPDRVAAVMAVWAVAWAGSKPFASLADGLLADSVGLQLTGMILAIPALIPITVLFLAPARGRKLAARGRLVPEKARDRFAAQPTAVPAAQLAGIPVGQAAIVDKAPVG